MVISNNFTLSEFTKSNTAIRLGISEQFTPSEAIVDNIRKLCLNTLEPIRTLTKSRILITSGYRCKRLNKAIGGSSTSQHMIGEAVDFTAEGMTVQELFELIKGSNVPYDQLIQEFDKWIHVSFSKTNRRQNLLATKVGGKTKYTIVK